ncbi:MAG: hypothetical protein DMF64_03360 [Acidobacteria bacterium]|nr:MAG: hypothetical protein DMF64_03360 [Acidobacteriota bacterium]
MAYAICSEAQDSIGLEPSESVEPQAKAQRRKAGARKLNGLLAVLLCVFAPLRAIIFFLC